MTGTGSDGKKLNYRGCDLYEFRGDKILKKDAYWESRAAAGPLLTAVDGRRKSEGPGKAPALVLLTVNYDGMGTSRSSHPGTLSPQRSVFDSISMVSFRNLSSICDSIRDRYFVSAFRCFLFFMSYLSGPFRPEE